MFRPWDRELEEEYQEWPKITEIMPVNSVGVVTARDKLTIHGSRAEVMEVVRDFANLPPETARERYSLGRDVRDWKVDLAQDDLVGSGMKSKLVAPILYRPFDTRFTYYTGKTRGFICMPRPEVMRHMLAGQNLGLITTRQTRDSWAALATSSVIAHKSLAAYDINSLFPIYIYPSEQGANGGLYQADERQPNLAPEFSQDFESRLGLRFIADGKGDLHETFGPEDVFHYIYAVFHSPTYRQRYEQFLRADFPRVPSIDDIELFRALVGLGRQLTQLHLMESPTLSQTEIGFPVPGDYVVESGYPKYVPPGYSLPGQAAPIEEGRVYISKDNSKSDKRGQYFEGISPDVWESRIGGYQPMEKWLKDRKGKALSFDDLNHYRCMGLALAETRRLMKEIDAAIEEAGGLFK